MDALPQDFTRRSSVFQLSWFVVLLASLLPAETFGLDYPQQQAYQRPQKQGQAAQKQIPGLNLLAEASNFAPPSNDRSFWSGVLYLLLRTLALVGLVLVSAAVGAGAMLFALRRKSPETLARLNWPPFARITKNQLKQWAFVNKARIGSHIKSTSSKPQQLMRNFLQRAKGRLVSLIPSRRLVFQLVCVVFGISLMAFSVYEFLHSEMLAGFLFLTLGYIVVAAVWLLSWNSAQSSEGRRTSHDTLTATPLAEIFPGALATLEISQFDEHLVTPTIDLGFDTATHWHHVDYAHRQLEPMSPAYARLLCCDDCNIRFNVRGQGELALRLIPCPQCGIALKTMNSEHATGELLWTPIVSVYCAQCHRLIDVPYGSIGGSACCPSCDADLRVPDTENRVKELRQMSNLSQA